MSKRFTQADVDAINARPRFKCGQCGGLKNRPGRCSQCGKLPGGFELRTEAQVTAARRRYAAGRRGKAGKEGA